MKYRNIARRFGASIAVAGTALVLSTGTALATGSTYLDPGVQGMYTGLSADFSSLVSFVWPVVLLVVGTFVAIKWTKKGGAKL